MPTSLVNLDALIPREDFEVADEVTGFQTATTLKISDLDKSAFLYSALRKPDFQRETANWSPQIVCDFVSTFLNGDLIPAVILWQSKSNVFVIDGGHRLSALIAWVHDDYGDGKISGEFFDNRIPAEQRKNAEKTRALVKKSVGTYVEHQLAVQYPDQAKPDVRQRAKRLGSLAIALQWVSGDSNKAEASFFKINQQAVPIDPTELKILKARHYPNALAARAIIRSGTGHKYWAKFEADKRSEIEKIAKEVNTYLFTPELQTPIKTLDLPVAGKGYSAQTLPLIFDLVNLANGVGMERRVPKKKKKAKGAPAEANTNAPALVPDADGMDTIKFLKNTRRVMYRISSDHPSSLGLHPVVYFYSLSGRYQPTSFLAVVSLIREFEEKDLFTTFTQNRRAFEDFILKYKTFSNQVTVALGSGIKGFARLEQLFSAILTEIAGGKAEGEIIEALRKDDRFRFLKLSESELEESRKEFNTEVKSATFLKDALTNPVRCKICGGLIHLNAMTIDHIISKKDGGTGQLENAQLAHPYCNTTFKEQGHTAKAAISTS